jgi:hypothetical protein
MLVPGYVVIPTGKGEQTMIYDIAGCVILALAWGFVCLVGHGYANTVDSLALALHRHAMDSRKRHGRRTATVQELWVRQLEMDGQPGQQEETTTVLDMEWAKGGE